MPYDSTSQTAYRKCIEDVKRKRAEAAAEEEQDDLESEYSSEEEAVTTVGRGLFISHRLDRSSGYYPAIFVRRDGDCPLLKRLSWREAALRNPRDLAWIKQPSKTPVDPTLPTYKDYGK